MNKAMPQQQYRYSQQSPYGPKVITGLGDARKKNKKKKARGKLSGSFNLQKSDAKLPGLDKKRLRCIVQAKYGQLSIVKLDALLLDYNRTLREAAISHKLERPVYKLGFQDGIKPSEYSAFWISYGNTKPGQQVIIRLYEGISRDAMFLCKGQDGTCLFAPTKEDEFQPLFMAEKAYPKKIKLLDKIKLVGFGDVKFKNLAGKIRDCYLNTFTDFLTLLIKNGFKKQVDTMLSTPGSFEIVRNEKTEHTIKARYHIADAKPIPSSDEIQAGDRVYCQLSSVIVVENTFSCVNRNHAMVPVILEVLIKHKGNDLPNTRELAAYYCQQCKRIFLYTTEFYRIYNLFKDSDYQFFNRFKHEGRLYGFSPSTSEWATESILKKAGYEVNNKSSLTQRERIEILLALNRIGVSYHRIISYLNHFIDMNGAAMEKDMSQAVQRWGSDIEVLRELYAKRILR